MTIIAKPVIWTNNKQFTKHLALLQFYTSCKFYKVSVFIKPTLIHILFTLPHLNCLSGRNNLLVKYICLQHFLCHVYSGKNHVKHFISWQFTSMTNGNRARCGKLPTFSCKYRQQTTLLELCANVWQANENA